MGARGRKVFLEHHGERRNVAYQKTVRKTMRSAQPMATRRYSWLLMEAKVETLRWKRESN